MIREITTPMPASKDEVMEAIRAALDKAWKYEVKWVQVKLHYKEKPNQEVYMTFES